MSTGSEHDPDEPVVEGEGEDLSEEETERYDAGKPAAHDLEES